MNHCERCGHKLTEHGSEGECHHHVTAFGRGPCPCDGYLRAEGTLLELIGQALYASPGRDSEGNFYAVSQARRVCLLVDALLDDNMPTKSIDAIELCEGWRDARAVNEIRWFILSCDENGQNNCHLYNRPANGSGRIWTHSSTTSPRDAAAKAIMKAGNDGAGS